MRFVPWRYKVKDEGDVCNAVYDFEIKGGSLYTVEIEIDELNDDKLISCTCTCPDHQFRGGKCKHIKASLDFLKSDGIECREADD